MLTYKDPDKASNPDELPLIVGFILVAIVLILIFYFDKPAIYKNQNTNITAALCHFEAVCSNFPGFRDACSTAGNFDKCMEIKMGSKEEYISATSLCTNDGNLSVESDKRPTYFDCWEEKIKERAP